MFDTAILLHCYAADEKLQNVENHIGIDEEKFLHISLMRATTLSLNSSVLNFLTNLDALDTLTKLT